MINIEYVVSVSFWNIFNSFWLDLWARKMAVMVTEHRNEELLADNSLANYSTKLLLKVSLKPKAAFYKNWFFLLVFYNCFCPSKR